MLAATSAGAAPPDLTVRTRDVLAFGPDLVPRTPAPARIGPGDHEVSLRLAALVPDLIGPLISLTAAEPVAAILRTDRAPARPAATAYHRRVARLGTRDLRALLDVVGAIGYEPDTDTLSLELLSALQTLVDAVWTDYIVEPAPPAKAILIEQSVAMAEDPWEEGPWQDVFWDLIYEFPVRAAPRVGVRLLRDVTTRRALERNAFFREWVIPADRLLQAMVTLPDRPDGAQRSIMFNTEATGKAFGERQRAMLETVRPYLCRPIEAADAVRRRQRAAGLTPRELELLAAVREGLTNAEIAARLVISEGTVRTHLQNASAKLGAHTRAEAVFLAWR